MDCLEHGSENLLKAVLPQLPAKLFEVLRLQQGLAKDEVSRDVVQTCIFGLGVLAMKVPTEVFPLAEVVQAVQWVYSMDFKTEKGLRAECCENATSSLAKCVYFHGQALQSQQLQQIVIQGVLAKMPLTTDTEEAQAAHALFL